MVAITIIGFTMCLLPRTRIYVDPQLQDGDYEYIQEEIQPVPKNWRGLSEKQIKSLSGLGRRMYLGDESAPPRTNRNFTILVWKNGPQLERRHMYHFGSTRHDPFSDCSVTNCRITYNSSELPTANAVLFHLHRTAGRSSLPAKHANPSQRWVFLTDENPYHTFTLGSKSARMRDFDGVFNWSMTYRMDSDVPVPSGRTLPLTESDRIIQKRKNKNKLAAIMISNCAGKNKRWDYVKELKKHMKLDVYGNCGQLKCEGHFNKDCPKLNDYKFYLAFENGDCKEYITEKAWWNAYSKGAVPVIMGASVEDCARLLPPKSYIHVRNFSSPASLARYLLYLSNSPREYNEFFKWRTQFKVVNEHGYFQSSVYHYCRLCEALNYNDPAPKVYDKLEDFWNKNKDCYPPVI